MSYLKATIVEVPGEKKSEFRVMLGNHEIGTSKTDFDARFHVHAINEALNAAYVAGQESSFEEEEIEQVSEEDADERTPVQEVRRIHDLQTSRYARTVFLL